MKVLSFILVFHISRLSATADSNYVKCRDTFNVYVQKDKLNDPATSNTLWLLLSRNGENNDLSRNFHRLINNLGFKIKILTLSRFCSDELVATEIVAEKFSNVINLKVAVPYNFDDTGNLTIAGYIGTAYVKLNKKTKVCRLRISNKTVTRGGKTYKESCEVTTVTTKRCDFVKLISKSIQKYPMLYQILNDFSLKYHKKDYNYWKKHIGKKDEPPFERLGYLLCDESENIQMRDLPSHIRVVKHCHKVENYVQHDLLATLAPEPLPEEEITFMPVVFYGIPYLLPEHKAVYPNSAVLYDNYLNLLAKGLMKLLETKNWLRVSVVSDDSPYSEAFEAELVKIFQENNVAYRLKPCETRHCDFRRSLESLKEEQASIVIVNVEKKRAESFQWAAAKFKSSRITWIWRDWPFKYDSDVEDMGNVFSIYITSINEDLDLSHDENKIDDAISLIDESFSNVKEELEQKSFRNRSIIFAETLKSALSNRSVKVNLRRIKESKIVYSAEVRSMNDVKVKKLSNSELNFDDPLIESCLIRNGNFISPCDDTYLLGIAITIFLLLLIVLTSYYIFMKYVNKTPRYSLFN